MTIVEIFEKMRAVCPYPCETAIRNPAESITVDFEWRFKIKGRDYGYRRSISMQEIELAHSDDNVLDFVFECADSEITQIGKEEAMLAVGQG